ncbi:Hypothetical predicted protein, partial [Paramuricea clavata]
MAAISYDEAQSRCEKSGYNLASFTSQAEIGQMETVMTDKNWEYWTGLKYTKSTDSWKFTDGTDTQFASRLLWLSNTNSQCVLIRGDGTLRATHCDGDWKYICCRVDQDHPRTVPPTSSGNDKSVITANITLGGSGIVELISKPSEAAVATATTGQQASKFTSPADTQNVTIIAAKNPGSSAAGILASFSNGIVTDDSWRCRKDPSNLNKWEKASTYRRNDLNISWNQAISEIKQNAQWIWVKDLSASRVQCKRNL